MDGRNPGGTGKRSHNAGGAQDRQPPDDAQPRVPGLFGYLRATGDGNLDLHIRRAAFPSRQFLDHRAHHLARHRVDRGLPRRDRQTGPGHPAHALARAEDNPARRPTNPRHDQRVMGHIGIIARILNHRRLGPARAPRPLRDGKADPLAPWQGDAHLVLAVIAPQILQRSLHGRGGAGPRGPAPAQLLRSLAHAVRLPVHHPDTRPDSANPHHLAENTPESTRDSVSRRVAARAPARGPAARHAPLTMVEYPLRPGPHGTPPPRRRTAPRRWRRACSP